MIVMSHVFKIYPSQISALSDISIEILPGDFAFILGPSGSGKSTLLRILCYTEKPTDGEVIIQGTSITQPGFKNIHPLRRKMGIISQDFKLLKDRTANENVAFALEVTGHGREEAKWRASDMLRRVGLEEREEDSILALSAGEQQRVAIARALVNSPPLLIADEPTGNLDAGMTIEMMKLFAQFHQKGTTIVFGTQYTGLVKLYPYRVIQILNGQILDGRKKADPQDQEVKTDG